MTDTTITCVVVLGPTATGKTRLAAELARRFSGEIVSADSRQVYRGLNLGTGKDLHEYGTGADAVPHFLIDVADPADDYNLFRFVTDARCALLDIRSRNQLPVIAGGTPMYLHALLEGYVLEVGNTDPALREELGRYPVAQLLDMLAREAPDLFERVDKTQTKRIIRGIEIARARQEASGETMTPPPLNPLLIGPYYERRVVHQRIAARLDERLSAGLVEEVEQLHSAGLSWERLDSLGLEYRYIAHYLQGRLTLDEMRSRLLAKIRKFCRSQDIWFRKMEREGRAIYWIPGGAFGPAAALVGAFLEERSLPRPSIRLQDTLYGPQTRPDP